MTRRARGGLAQLYPCEELLGEMLAHWKKRQLKLQKDVKQVRPFIATRSVPLFCECLFLFLWVWVC